MYQKSSLIILITPDKKEHRIFGINDLNLLNPNLVKDISVYRDKETLKKYGNDAKYGVIKITYKNQISISVAPINLKKVLATYKINTDILPLYVDSIWVNHPESVYISTDQILSITVEEEKESGIKFIDILTKNPPRKPKKGEIMLRGITTYR